MQRLLLGGWGRARRIYRYGRDRRFGAVAWPGPVPGCETRSSMDFDLSDDQEALRDGARELLDGLASPVQVRAHADGGAAYDPGLWNAMADQGWLAIEVP